MINKILLLISLIITTTYPCAADSLKPIKIVTTITPIASLIKMLTNDHAIVESIMANSSCPDHYHSSFGDLKKIRDADLVIYIDEKFDHFITKLIQQNDFIIRLSDIKELNIINNHGNNNWHFWLDLNNVKILLQKVAIKISEKFPELQKDISINLTLAQNEIDKLKQIKTEKLKNLANIVIASDSMEYFFLEINYVPQKIFQYDHNSLQYLTILGNLQKDKKNYCIIVDDNANIKIYQKFNFLTIQVDSENWKLFQIGQEHLSELFYEKYLEIVTKLTGCK